MSRESIPVHFIESDGEAIVKSDTTNVNYKSLYVGTGGNLTVQLTNSLGTITYTNIPDGTFMPIAVVRVLAATTASDMIGHF